MTTTAAPAAARCLAIEAPIPLDAPVTMATFPLSLWVLVEVILRVLIVMLEGIQNPVVRIENLGGHLRAFFTIPGEMQAKRGVDQISSCSNPSPSSGVKTFG